MASATMQKTESEALDDLANWAQYMEKLQTHANQQAFFAIDLLSLLLLTSAPFNCEYSFISSIYIYIYAIVVRFML